MRFSSPVSVNTPPQRLAMMNVANCSRMSESFVFKVGCPHVMVPVPSQTKQSCCGLSDSFCFRAIELVGFNHSYAPMTQSKQMATSSSGPTYSSSSRLQKEHAKISSATSSRLTGG